MNKRYFTDTSDLPSVELTLPPRSIPEARSEASSYVRDFTDELAIELGFGFTATKDAPRSANDLYRAVVHSMATGDPLPVTRAASASSALQDADDDQRLGFWQSVVRFRRGLGFDMPNELAIDLSILDAAAFWGVGTPGRSVLYAALVGQTIGTAVLGAIPADTRQFTTNVLIYGLTDAILLEHESRPYSANEVVAKTTTPPMRG